MEKRRIETKDMVMVAMFAAILAVISQISLPMPSGVPITIQVFGMSLVGAVLGSKKGFLSVLVYVLLGAVGLPIFANFRGGLSVLVGTTGGYLLTFPILALCAGLIKPDKSWGKRIACIAVALVGLMICEFYGGLQWYLLTRGDEGAMTYQAIMAYSFVAFIPKDTILTILGVIVGEQVRRPLVKGGMLK